MPQCGSKEHGLAYNTFYVQKYIAHLVTLFCFPAGSGRAAKGTRICEIRLSHDSMTWPKFVAITLS